MNQGCCDEKKPVSEEYSDEECRLADGYREMSRINLSLAEEGVKSDNDAFSVCEQKLAECE